MTGQGEGPVKSDPGTRVTFAPDQSRDWATEEPIGEVVVPTD